MGEGSRLGRGGRGAAALPVGRRAAEATATRTSTRPRSGLRGSGRTPRARLLRLRSACSATPGSGRRATSAPYPGFEAFPYREYSEVFFGRGYRVLRGGSWATRPAVARTFRNWDLPQRRQIFGGFRCADDWRERRRDVAMHASVRHRVLDVRDTLADEFARGLAEPLKELPPKYFYDEHGSELFDRITSLPEYYPTRCERAILNRHAPGIVDRRRGAGGARLGHRLQDPRPALRDGGAGTLERYVPFDVDESVVQACAVELVELYPGLDVHGVVGRLRARPRPGAGGRPARCSPSSGGRSATSIRRSAAPS